jgi:hypothetical protein
MARDIYWATAHEAADTVVQILCGQGWTYGLGWYRSLWQGVEVQMTVLGERWTDEERAALAERQMAWRTEQRELLRVQRRREKLIEKIAGLKAHIHYYQPTSKQAQKLWAVRLQEWRSEVRTLERELASLPEVPPHLRNRYDI